MQARTEARIKFLSSLGDIKNAALGKNLKLI